MTPDPHSSAGPVERTSETWVNLRTRLSAKTALGACLVHIYPTGPGMGTRYTLGSGPVVLGRGQDCEISIDNHSVSRRHARIEPKTDGYYAVDLQSTNGTYVNDELVVLRKLRDGDYLRVGNCIYRFLMGGNVEAEYHEEVYRLTIIDALTDIHNRRYLFESLDREVSRSSRYGRPLSLLMLDIDHFRVINEELGHLGGDFTLRELAARIKGIVRKDELFARYGGEEFAVVLPETDRDGAVQLAERLLGVVRETPVEYEGRQCTVTVSAGLATTVGEKDITPAELIRRADEKLCQAKHEGRDRLVG